MVDALVVVEAVESPEDLVAEGTDGAVKRLEVLLLLVPLERQLRRECLAADVAGVADARGQEAAVQRVREPHRQDRGGRSCAFLQPVPP
jgi:hypothetical protein